MKNRPTTLAETGVLTLLMYGDLFIALHEAGLIDLAMDNLDEVVDDLTAGD